MENEKREDISGYLKKRKGSGFFRMFGNTNLRWFELDFTNKIFGYKGSLKDKKFKESIPLNEIKDFITSLSIENKKSCEWRYGFSVKAKYKTFILFAQKESEFKQWQYAFNIVLKRIPEAFPKIRDNIFRVAIKYFEKPYLEAIRKRILQEERELKKREEEKIKRKKLEEEERIKKEMEHEEMKRKLIEEEQERYRLEQIKLKEEERQKKWIEENKKKKKLYDDRHESIISEVHESILYNEEYTYNNENEKSYISENPNRSLLNNSTLNFKEDLDDWNFYNELDQKIEEKDLIMYNPISKETNKSKIKNKEEVDLSGMKGIKNLFKNSTETMRLNAPLILNITSTKEEIYNNYNNSNNQIVNIEEEEIESSVKITTDIKSLEQETFQIPKNDTNKDSTTKYKKARFFKKKTDDSNNITSSYILTDNTSFYKEETLKNISSQNSINKSHIDPNIAKSLVTNVPLNTYEQIKDIKPKINNNPNIKLTVQGQPVAPSSDLRMNYVTNPAKKIEELSIEEEKDKENWFEDNKQKLKRNVMINSTKLNNSCNEITGDNRLSLDINESFTNTKKNHSINYNNDNETQSMFSNNSIVNQNLSLSHNCSNFEINELNNSIADVPVMPVNQKNHYNIDENADYDSIKEYRKKKSETKTKNNLFENILGEVDEFDLVLNKKSVSKDDPKKINKISNQKITNDIDKDKKYDVKNNNHSKINSDSKNVLQGIEPKKKSITITTNQTLTESPCPKITSPVKEIQSWQDFSFDNKDNVVEIKRATRDNMNTSLVEDFDEW